MWILRKCNGCISALNFLIKLHFGLKDYVSVTKININNNSPRSLGSLRSLFIAKILQYDYLLLIILYLQIITIKLPPKITWAIFIKETIFYVSKYICFHHCKQSNVSVAKGYKAIQDNPLHLKSLLSDWGGKILTYDTFADRIKSIIQIMSL